MAQIKSFFKNISSFSIGAKVVVIDKESNEKAVLTHVSFDVDTTPGEFNDILLALAANHPINVTFESPQEKLDME
jgi:hypothetical protein